MGLRGIVLLIAAILVSGCGSLQKNEGQSKENLSRKDCGSGSAQNEEICRNESEVANYRAQNY